MKCGYCTLILKDLTAYKRHHTISHSNRPFKCPNDCGRLHTKFRDLSIHFSKCQVPLEPLEPPVLSAVSTEVSPCLASTSEESFCDSPEAILPNFNELLRSEADTFVSKLCGMPKLPRQHVQKILCEVQNFISSGILGNLKKCIENKEPTVDFSQVFKDFEAPFSHVLTDYRLLEYFKKFKSYIPPVSYELGQIDVTVRTKRGTRLQKKVCYGQHIPLSQTLKQFLEIPNALEDILSYMKSLKDDPDTVENYIQCKLWAKQCEKYAEDDIVLPLVKYYDDFECNNALGSSCLKLGGVYVSIPCLPPECQACLDYIFVALLFETRFRCFSDETIFAPLIAELKCLEKEGIILNLPGGPKKVFFVSSLLLGDNLGVNSVGGFAEGFTANFYCRFCKTPKHIMDGQCKEDKSSLRTIESYKADCAINNVTETGVRFNSALNELPSFHIVNNFSVDIFHDLAEGTCHYTMIHILREFIPKYFTLDFLNNRIEMFQYGLCDSNKMPLVPDDFATRTKLKMTGSETLLFVRLFGYLVGDKIPRDDLFWRLYIKLRELLDVCYAKSFSSTSSTSLNVLVEEFNTMYTQVTGDILKAKMHLGLHYGTVVENSGPLVNLQTIRFEGKHRHLLMPAHCVESRRNICKTLAINHQLSQCHKFKSKTSILPSTEFGPVCEIDVNDFENLSFVEDVPKDFSLHSSLSTSWVDFKGSLYKPGMVLLISINDSGPVFGLLEVILVNGNSFVFVYSKFVTIGFDDQLHSYEVESHEDWSCTVPSELLEPLPLSLYTSVNGKKTVILRHLL